MQNLIQKLTERLKEPLPGIVYQSQMMPGNRVREYPDEATLAAARKAGVCFLLYQKNEDWYTVLIQRTTYKGVHSGQMAFPGGTYEEEDTDLTATALRETEEEIGIKTTEINVLGKLSPIYIPPSQMYVEPLLAFWTGQSAFQKEEKEVAKIIEVSVKDLIDPTIRKKKPIEVGKGLLLNTPYFDVYDHTVWGATAAMISEFVQIIKEVEIS